MKKVWAIAFLGCLAAASCSSKDENKESNIMLEEPKVETMDSTAVAKPSVNASVPMDSASMKKMDSAK